MEKTYFNTKRLILFSAIVMIVTSGLKAQDSITDQKQSNLVELSIGYHSHDLEYGNINFQMIVAKEICPRFYIGGGWGFGTNALGLNDNNDNLPFEDFSVNISEVNLIVATAYCLKRGFVSLEGLFGYNNFYITAFDKRCEIEEEMEAGSITTNQFYLARIDNLKWKPNVNISLRISYILPIGKYFITKFTAGYDFLPKAYKSRLNENIEVTSSNWSDFETYYGTPEVNLYESSEAVRKICSNSQFYFGISVGFIFY